MCGRFVFFADDKEEKLKDLIVSTLPDIHGLDLLNMKRGDVYPSQDFPVIVDKAHNYFFENMKWGYPPVSKQSKRLLINARSETVADKYSFRNDFRSHRCIIPATGFYEWNKEKQKYLFDNPTGLLFIGGIYQPSEDFTNNRFLILTKAPDHNVSLVHNRMPVLIPLRDARQWLTSEADAKEIFKNYSVNVEGKEE